MIWNEILCLGDSITYGARDPYKRSYPEELGKILRKVIMGTLPELSFTPLYISNTKLINEYNKSITKLSKTLNFDICDLSGTEKFYIDGVHYTHKGNIELANRFTHSILNIRQNK